MLAVCVATQVIQRGDPARCIPAQRRAHPVGRATTAGGRQRVLRPLLQCDVRVVDAGGDLPTEAAVGPAVYALVAGRDARRPIILTSNTSLTEWATRGHAVRLAAASVDRLLQHGPVFYVKGPSWRRRGRSLDGGMEPQGSGDSVRYPGSGDVPRGMHDHHSKMCAMLCAVRSDTQPEHGRERRWTR